MKLKQRPARSLVSAYAPLRSGHLALSLSALAAAMLCMVVGLALAMGKAWATPPHTAPSLTQAPAGTPSTSRQAALGDAGYVEQEYLLQGQAKRYLPDGPWEADGHWGVQASTEAQPYATRLLVRRPKDASRFNGVVVVEWLNTAVRVDVDGIWLLGQDEMLREGYAWVGVSSEARSLQGLQQADAQRYAALHIASDDLAFDIFTQAGQALRQDAEQVLGWPAQDPRPLTLLAGGYSRSAGSLTTYINAFQRDKQVYDGFLLHGKAPLSEPVVANELPKFVHLVRADLGVPVMQLQTEMEAMVSWPLSKTQDTDTLRYWEIAGAAHFDARILDGVRRSEWQNPYIGQTIGCYKPPNDLPTYEVVHAALHALRKWVQDGTPAPHADKLQRNALGFVRNDAHGNAMGGLRLPELSVPTAQYGMYSNFSTSSLSLWGMYACVAGGSANPFDEATLRSLYPSRQDYLTQYKAAADALLAAGFLRPADHAQALERARNAHLPF